MTQNTVYIAIDGDNVGSQLEYFMLTNDVEHLQQFTNKFANAMSWFSSELKSRFDAEMLFLGGDNALFRLVTSIPILETIESLKNDFSKESSRTISVGIGSSPRKAYFALKFAKTSGKNTIRIFDDLPKD